MIRPAVSAAPAAPPPPPAEPTGPTRREVINGLLHALALRELAVAHLLNAEAEKVAHVARTMTRPETFDDVITFQRTIAELMQALVRKEEVLLRRLNAVLELCATEEPPCGCSDSESSGDAETDGCESAQSDEPEESPPCAPEAAGEEPPIT